MTDWRLPGTRRELFHRFYSFHLKYRSHPGGVYYVLPHLAAELGWDMEQRAWAAWINGNTQNPVTTLLLMSAGDRPERADAMLNWFFDHEAKLAWDTDRRYHRKQFARATLGYLEATSGGQENYWRRGRSWGACWEAARVLPTMGRLSAWSYLEYLKLLGVGNVPDSDTLMLDDISGSRSHRNGLALVGGHEDWMWWRFSPGSTHRVYTSEVVRHLSDEAADILAEAQSRNPGHPDVGYLTLESAFCTFKSWHVPNRRYSGVYNDMLHDRIRQAETRFGKRFDLVWEARRAALPRWMRMEDTPGDPGCVPTKQNWFLNTGQPVTLGREYPEIGPCGFDAGVDAGTYAGERKWS